MHHSTTHSLLPTITQNSTAQRSRRVFSLPLLLWVFLATHVTAPLAYADNGKINSTVIDHHKEEHSRITRNTDYVSPYKNQISGEQVIPAPSNVKQKNVDAAQLMTMSNDARYSTLLPQHLSEADKWTLLSFTCAVAGVLCLVFSRSPWFSDRNALDA